MAAVRESCPGLLPATHHTASLLPTLRLVGPLSNPGIPFTLSSREKTICFLGWFSDGLKSRPDSPKGQESTGNSRNALLGAGKGRWEQVVLSGGSLQLGP